MLANMKTGTKILVGFALVFMIMLVLGLLSVGSINEFRASIDTLGGKTVPAVRTLNAIMKAELRIGNAIRGLVISRTDPAQRALEYADAQAGMRQAEEGRRGFEALPRSADEQQAWSAVRVLWDPWQSAVARALDLARERDRLASSGAPAARIAEADDRFLEAERDARARRLALNDGVDALIQVAVAHAEAASKNAHSGVSRNQDLLLVSGTLATLAMALIGICLAVGIGRAIQRLVSETTRLAGAAVAGELGARGDPLKLSPEFRPVLVGVNDTLDALLGPLTAAAQHLERMARGDIPPKITERYSGEFNSLKESVNQCIDSLNRLQAEMAHVTAEHDAGDIDVMVPEDRFEGAYRAMASGVNNMVRGHIALNKKAMACIAEFACGNFDAPLAQFPGKKAFINENVERLRKNVKDFIREMATMSDEHDAGDIDVMVPEDRFEGAYRAMAKAVNDMVKGHIALNRKAMSCVAAFGQGHFEAPLEQFPGKKGFINVTIDTLRANLRNVSSEIRELVDAGKAGHLEARGNAANFQGDWALIVSGLNNMLEAVLSPVREATQVLEALASYDLRARVKGEYQGDHARIKQALNSTGSALHDALMAVASAVEQVAGATRQIAASSQSVAQGSSEQASALEETSSSLEQISGMTQQNVDNTVQARTLAQTTKETAEKGGRAMERMMEAMEKIRTASEGTSQIIRDINDIAFQTNLLALNAAVEAARAGEAGRGFAVVAEEVRNLALRSKEAAKKTEDLIRVSVGHAESGRVIATEMAANLTEIVSAAGKVRDIVSEIAVASQEQSRGIEEVNRAVAEMDRVVQTAAASAEESSSAAEELAGQAEELGVLVGRFVLIRSVRSHPREHDVRGQRSPTPSLPVRRGTAGRIKPGNGQPTAIPLTPEELIPLKDDPEFKAF
jgi:methyl-accepting chemotaxis protein